LDQSQLVETIIQTINTLFSTLFTSIDNNIYENLDSLVFIDSSILSNSTLKNLLGANSLSGFVSLTNAMLVGVVIFYIIRFYYANFVDLNIEKPYQFIFKVLIFMIAINSSYFLLQQVLQIFYYCSAAIQTLGKMATSTEISFSQLIVSLNKLLEINSTDFNFFSFDGLIKSFVSIGLLNILLSYSLRYILVQALLLFSPFAILTLINSSTAWIFKSWARAVFALLILQLFVPIIIIVVFCIDLNNKILFIGGIYAITRINGYVREMFGGLSTDISGNMSNLLSFLKH